MTAIDPEATYEATVALPGRVWVEVAKLARATSTTTEQTIEAAVLRRLNAVTNEEARAMRELDPSGLPGHSPAHGRRHV